jgi:hypothetical protein
MGFELSPSWKSGLSQAIAAAHRLNWGRAGVAGGLGLRVVGLTRAGERLDRKLHCKTNPKWAKLPVATGRQEGWNMTGADPQKRTNIVHKTNGLIYLCV